ncbi:alpha/beta fold hydrolase [Flavobacterium sp. N1736]|uniref:alpha/beta fold hydrolase n=1 Tax=Flavobacterium sp. N1736 TaxID=2986823 RepID=UPI002225B2BB|nr:hypothetical protein [Flavobacterium sp. N1736]
MKKSIILFAIFLLSFGTISAQTEIKIPYGNKPEAGHYKEINGFKMYYEVYGTGEPLVLLHGNGGSIKGHTSFFTDPFKKTSSVELFTGKK